MDIQTGLVCVGLVILSGAILLVVSLFGIKETTYEEAIAEQRRMPEGALLLRRPAKDKSKDKKPKRLGKKVKEKKKDTVTRQSSSETDEPAVSEQETAHVKIMPEATVFGEGQPDEKRKKKKEKIKPILVNRDTPTPVDSLTVTTVANHFEDTVPKDDLTLRKLSKTDINDTPKELSTGVDAVKTIVDQSNVEVLEKHNKNTLGKAKVKDATLVKEKKTEVDTKPKVFKQIGEESVSSGSTPVDSSPIQHARASKDKKKSKKSFEPMNVDVSREMLEELILKAELSHHDVQLLTDLLLNKFQDDRVDHSDWSLTRLDPIKKLQKQLAEKEEMLASETASALAFQNKVKELRAELNAERSKLSSSVRSYDEGLVSKQNEIQSLQNRLHQQSMLFEGEKQKLMQTIQQLNIKVKDDSMVIRKLQENSQELLNYREQNQQMQLHISRLNENENSLKNQFHVALNERDQVTTSYNSELQKNRRLEEELREAMSNLDATQGHHELVRKFEEVERSKEELDKKLRDAIQSEEKVTFEKSRLEEEIHHLTNKIAELQSDNEKIHSDRKRLEKEKSDLAEEIGQLQGNKDKAVMQAARENKTLHDEVAFIRQEKERLEVELSQNQSNKDDASKDLAKMKELEERVAALTQRLEAEQRKNEEAVEQLTKLTRELDAQKNKNNDLRQKNWKAMDALGMAEKALESKIKQTDDLVNKQTEQARQEEQVMCKELLERLFPQINISEGDYRKWSSSFEKSVKELLEEQVDTTKLQHLVTHYKNIIDDTEGMLNKLQKHIEEEEIRWTEQLGNKQSEISLLEKERSQLQERTSELEENVRRLKLVGDESRQQLAELNSEIIRVSELATMEKDRLASVCNEKDQLESKLKSEQERVKELNKEIVKLRSNLKIGQDSYEAEHKIRVQLEEQIKTINCRGNGDNGTVADGAVVESPENKRRKSKNAFAEWIGKMRSPNKRRDHKTH